MSDVGQTPGRPIDPSAAVLSGVRIVDLSSGIAGPFAANLFAEFGADVVKVEAPSGDSAATASPLGYRTWNRSKTVVSADLGAGGRSIDGLEVLLQHADVLIHDEEVVVGSALHSLIEDAPTKFPRLIIGRVTPYPLDHPDAGRPGSELLVTARLGALDEQEGRYPGPFFTRYPFASWGAAYLLASGIAVRLWERRRSGIAKPIFTSLLQGALVPASLYWQRAELPPDWMTRHTLPKLDNPAHLTIFECRDGRWIQVLGGFTKTAAVRNHLQATGSSAVAGDRVTAESRPVWAEVMSGRDSNEWLSDLWREDIACMPVLDPGELFGLPQVSENRYSTPVEDPELGSTIQAGHPIEFDPPARVNHAPSRGMTVADEARRWDDRSPSPVSEGSGDLGRWPLAGIRVIDFGSYVAGPLGAQCLADFGADVIKIEPLAGEKARQINQFTACHRGKRSLALDLRSAGARDVLKRLISSADIVTHNVRPQAARKLGIDDDSIWAINPRAIVAASTAYGTNGPWSSFPAYDPTALALSGVERMIAGPDQRPIFLRNSSMDSQTGLALFLAAVLGLYQRELTGRGMRVGTSLLAVGAVASSETMIVDGQLQPTRTVDQAQMGVAWNERLYSASDGWIAVDAATEEHQHRLLRTLGCIREDELEKVIGSEHASTVSSRLDNAGVPNEIVTIDGRDRFFDAELGRRSGLVERTARSPYGWFENPGGFWSDGQGVIRLADGVPGIGEHTVGVLNELGFSAAEVEALIDAGVVGIGDASRPT